MILTIVICTYNRSNLLKKCLLSLKRQVLQNKNTEIVVIDNSSTDNTKKVTTSFAGKDKKIRYFVEKKIGLSYARNRGWSEAKGDFVAYIDDDSIADKQWIKNILRFIKTNPKATVFGGPYFALNKKELPSWLPPEVAQDTHGKRKKILEKNEFLSGTNMIYQRKLIKKNDGFSVNLGMSGKKMGYGEETELQIRLKKKNIDIYYDPKIIVYHLFDKRKMSFSWLIKAGFSNGQSSYHYNPQKSLLTYVYQIFKSLIWGFYLFFFKNIRKDIRENLFLSFRETIMRSGQLSEKIKNLS